MSAPVRVHPNDIKWAVAPVREALADPKVRPAFPVDHPEKVPDIDVMNAALTPVDRKLKEDIMAHTGSSIYITRRLMVSTDIGEVLAGDDHYVVLHQGDRAGTRAKSKWRAACWETRSRSLEVARILRKHREGGTS